MIVYVETNFLLEIAYQQERCDTCRELLDLSECGLLSLVIPAVSTAEARTTWDRKLSERNVLLRDQLQPLIRQLSRSQQFQALPETSKDLIAGIVASGEDARIRMDEAIVIIRRFGEIDPLTAEVLDGASTYERSYSLTPPDAAILANIIAHAQASRRSEMLCQPRQKKVWRIQQSMMSCRDSAAKCLPISLMQLVTSRVPCKRTVNSDQCSTTTSLASPPR